MDLPVDTAKAWSSSLLVNPAHGTDYLCIYANAVQCCPYCLPTKRLTVWALPNQKQFSPLLQQTTSWISRIRRKWLQGTDSSHLVGQGMDLPSNSSALEAALSPAVGMRIENG